MHGSLPAAPRLAALGRNGEAWAPERCSVSVREMLDIVSDTPDLRCSAYSRAHQVDPIGTAGSYVGYVLVEWPLPWPADLGEVDALAPLAALAAERGWRLQGLVAREAGALRSVICYAAPAGPFRAFERRELTVRAEEVIDAARSLIDAADNGEGGVGGPREAEHDVLVCSHGRRDRCCGSLGAALALELVDGALPAPGGAQVRVWRTSHTGGHRFAPTGIVLPEGTMWGYLDVGRLATVLGHAEPAADALAGYRGCSGLPARELQALERAVIAELGWGVLDAHRSGSVERPTSGRGAAASREPWPEVTLDLEWEDGRRASYRAEVGVARPLPIPDCGSPVERSRKIEYELGLRGLQRLR